MQYLRVIAAFAVLGASVGLVAFAEPSEALEPQSLMLSRFVGSVQIPEPAPAKPSCPISSVPARATLIAHPDYPEGAAQEYTPREAGIAVTLSSTGALEGATIFKSSGNKSLDVVSLTAARQSVYTPEYTDCHAVGGTYLFRSFFGATQ